MVIKIKPTYYHLMIKRFLCSLFIMILPFANQLYGQITMNGIVKDQKTELPLANVTIYCEQTQKVIDTDGEGKFTLIFEEEGSYDLIIYHHNYTTSNKSFNTENKELKLIIWLEPLSVDLSPVEIKARKKEIFALRSLNEIEGTTINAGKKTEVVILDLISANFAANISRQIYAQVAGLNIYEGSDGGLQLSIGGRGLDPNRTSNFNTRQNGYDISADVLGYPESYYTPPPNALNEIQIIRGASSLQYGTQFGGLLNFKLNKIPKDKVTAGKASLSVGSNGLLSSYTSLGFNKKGISLNVHYNYKRGDGYRANSEFTTNFLFSHLEYTINPTISLSAEFTYYTSLAKQAGGLTDQQFSENPFQSTRDRNWFDVDWKLYNIQYKHQLTNNSKIHLSFFGLSAGRKSLGFRGNPNNLNENPITALDEKDANGQFIHLRDLIIGEFKNYGLELRFLAKYQIAGKKSAFLIGSKWYDASNTAVQGAGSKGVDADFELQSTLFPDYPSQSDFRFPNRNLAFFGENIFHLNNKLSFTPGFRLEYINTGAIGNYNQVVFDNAGNPIANNKLTEDKNLKRNFILLGLGLEYKKSQALRLFANLSQNYRSITFSDIRIVSPTFIVDPDLNDEKGYTSDIGISGRIGRRLSYNAGLFSVWYQDRIGIILDDRANRLRTNIGDAFIGGFESLIDLNIREMFMAGNGDLRYRIYGNFAYTYSQYISSQKNNVVGKKVEFVPEINLKTGIKFNYRKLGASLQLTYLSKQFTDAQNSPIAQPGGARSGVIGEIPAYTIMDLDISYQFKSWKWNTGINNLMDKAYFTRRATGYPGPGIIPSEGRSWYLSMSYEW